MEEQELIDMASYCNNILIKYGENVSHCKAIYLRDDNVIEFQIRYRANKNETYHKYQYIIENFNYIMTDTDIKVNRTTVNDINNEIEKRIYKEYASI